MSDTIVVYVSGHGFGHGVRAGLVVEQLQTLRPSLRIVVRSSAPQWLFPTGIDYWPGPTDIGVLQADSLSPLVDETLARAAAFELERPELARHELAMLQPLEPRAVVSDIPPLAFDVAHALGVPSVAIGNFSWDWIYRTLGPSSSSLDVLLQSIRQSEAKASILLRLPFHGDMSVFPHVEDIPLIARVSRAEPRETRQRLGIPVDRPAVLLSFGGFELGRLDFTRLAHLTDFVFVTTLGGQSQLPANVIACAREQAAYHDLLAACDVVVMKPGYGTVVDCLAHRRPMVYTTRPGFMEEAILVEEMQRMGPAAFISQTDLLAGNLRPSLEAVLASNQPWGTVRLDGAEVAARRILEWAGLVSTLRASDEVEHGDLRRTEETEGVG